MLGRQYYWIQLFDYICSQFRGTGLPMIKTDYMRHVTYNTLNVIIFVIGGEKLLFKGLKWCLTFLSRNKSPVVILFRSICNI